MRCLAIAATALIATSSLAANWQYDTSKDKMTDATSKTAIIQSENSLSLSFPYSGKNHGSSMVRQHPQYGLDVVIAVDKGQIQCGVSDCAIQLRIDGGKVTKASFARAADGTSTVIFARNPRPLIAQLSKAKTMMVQLPMFRQGEQVLEFAFAQPLEWSLPAPRAKKK